VIERRAIDVETLVPRALSMGSTSPAHLGDSMDAMVTEIRTALAECARKWWKHPPWWLGAQAAADNPISRCDFFAPTSHWGDPADWGRYVGGQATRFLPPGRSYCPPPLLPSTMFHFCS
jgi:hypothetical protein